jgi:hypothetical protein
VKDPGGTGYMYRPRLPKENNLQRLKSSSIEILSLVLEVLLEEEDVKLSVGLSEPLVLAFKFV